MLRCLTIALFFFQDDGIPLFAGAGSTTESFMKDFEAVCDKHKMAKNARQDFLKLFAKNLPVTNNLFSKISIPFLPNISTTKFENAKFCTVDIKTQLEKILKRDATKILLSWDDNCSWTTKWDHLKPKEIQLVLNVDGAPVFKSSKLSVWPIWVQIFNLPPKLRSVFSNLSLLGLWHGKSKPDFSKLLPLVCFELDSLRDAKLHIDELGLLNFRVRSLVADMPATACCLCMIQFNGYSSCPHCYIFGFSQIRRMLFSCNKEFKLRENLDFRTCGWYAEKIGSSKCGVKSSTPLNNLMSLPWDCPIDPMHQLFLGTGKILTKLIISLLKGNNLIKVEKTIKDVKVPFDVKHRPKSLGEVNFWKAFDFKMFFFHIGSLILNDTLIPAKYLKSFCQLSFAIRLLSDCVVEKVQIEKAEKLINLFFKDFLELYGANSQSFNFHTMRHLCEQVRRNGPLWLFSAFCFESANHNLLSAVQGTVKEPEAIVEHFVKHQASINTVDCNSSEKYLKGLTVIENAIKLFCEDYNVSHFLSRFVSRSGICFCSLSYSRIGDNLGDCVFQLKDGRFFRVNTYFSNSHGQFAVGKAVKNVRKISSEEILIDCGFLFERFGLDSLEKIPLSDIRFKTIVLVQQNILFVSLMKEGFEHNFFRLCRVVNLVYLKLLYSIDQRLR